MKKPIYLDNNATTKVDPKVVGAMLPYFTTKYANPSSLHFFGQSVANDVNKARELISEYINCDPSEIVFTASGSEADNLCIKGYCEINSTKGKHIITSSIEHPAVINTYKNLEKRGFKITYLNVNSEGFVAPKDVEKNIGIETILVSVMHANNEVGSIQPIEKIALICKDHGIAFHTDAVQSFTKVPIDVKKMNVDMASFAGHKIHAPKGIGFAYIKNGLKVSRQTDGGSQERLLRAGTENCAFIVGLAKAISLASDEDVAHMKRLQKYLIDSILTRGNVRINGPLNLRNRICNNINISTNKITGELLLNELSKQGICVSTGSACSSKSTKVSPILLAIDCPTEYLHGNIRISISKYTTKKEIYTFLEHFDKILNSKHDFVLKKL